MQSTPIKFISKPYQRLIARAIQENKRCAIWAGMGLGKTVSVLTSLVELDLLEDVFPALVIGPLRTVKATWPQEIKKWEHTFHLNCVEIVGKPNERLTALNKKADIYAINYEQLSWLVETLKDKWPFRTVIADESTKLKGFRTRQGAKRPKALAMVAHTLIKRFIELTGTPSPNGIKDLWGQLWFLDKGQRLGKSYTAFSDRWFTSSYDGFSVTPKEYAQKEIQDLLKDICFAVDAKDWFDLKEPIVNKIKIDLPTGAALLYKRMEKEMFMEIENEPVEALNAAAKTMKCLQIANGAAYTEEGKKWKVIHDEKLFALDSIIEEAAGMPILVAYHFKSDLARLQNAYPLGRHLDANPKTISEWNQGRIPLLFAHPASSGHGLNLQDGGNILVFFSVNWNLEEHQQIIERIGPVRQLQAGHDRPTFIHYLLAKDTVDELVLERLETKREVQDILLEAMKTHHENTFSLP